MKTEEKDLRAALVRQELESERLCRERDAARAEVCALEARFMHDRRWSADEIRERRGWGTGPVSDETLPPLISLRSGTDTALRELILSAQARGGFDSETWTFTDPFCAAVDEVCFDALVDLACLTEERDTARRMACESESRHNDDLVYADPVNIAKARGWDCYKTENKDNAI